MGTVPWPERYADKVKSAGQTLRAIRDATAATDMMTVIGPVTSREDGTGVVLAPLVH